MPRTFVLTEADLEAILGEVHRAAASRSHPTGPPGDEPPALDTAYTAGRIDGANHYDRLVMDHATVIDSHETRDG
jgi:hypothetical protein